MHLKAIQRMNDQVQRPIGVPPLSDPRFEQAIMAGATGLVASTLTTTSGSTASHAPLSTHPHPPSTMMMMTTSEIQTPQFKNGLQSTGATAVESSYSSSSAAVFPLSSGYHPHPHGFSSSSSGQIRVMDNHHHNCDDIDDDGDDVDQHHHHRNPEQNRIKNPLSGMGEQYTMILQNIVNGDGLIMNESPMNGSTANPSSSSNLILSPPPSSSSLLLPPSLSSSLMGGGSSREKRGYEESELLDGSLSGRKEKKRSRFEVIE